MTRAAGVDDCQTAMTQTRAPARVVNRFRSPNTFIVATTMLYGLQHRAYTSFGIEADYSGNSTHSSKIVMSDE
jgi:hypothetical protein